MNIPFLNVVIEENMPPDQILLVGKLTEAEKLLDPQEQLRILARRSGMIYNMSTPDSGDKKRG